MFVNFSSENYKLQIWPSSHLLLQGGMGSPDAYDKIEFHPTFQKIKKKTIEIPPGGCLLMTSWTVHRGMKIPKRNVINKKYIFFASINNGEIHNRKIGKDKTGALPLQFYEKFIDNGLILEE